MRPGEKSKAGTRTGLGVQIPLRSRVAGNVRRIPFMRLYRKPVSSCAYLHGFLKDVSHRLLHTPVNQWRRFVFVFFHRRAPVAVRGRLSWCVHEFLMGYEHLSTVNVQLTDHCSRSKSNVYSNMADSLTWTWTHVRHQIKRATWPRQVSVWHLRISPWILLTLIFAGGGGRGGDRADLQREINNSFVCDCPRLRRGSTTTREERMCVCVCGCVWDSEICV